LLKELKFQISAWDIIELEMNESKTSGIMRAVLLENKIYSNISPNITLIEIKVEGKKATVSKEVKTSVASLYCTKGRRHVIK